MWSAVIWGGEGLTFVKREKGRDPDVERGEGISTIFYKTLCNNYKVVIKNALRVALL